MSAVTDPALYGESNYERQPLERYFTEPWVTHALLRVAAARLMDVGGAIWEPACGRGDMVRVLLDCGYEAVASDINMSEFDEGLCPCYVLDFLNHNMPRERGIRAIITNPPYGKPKGPDYAERFIRRALKLPEVQFVALLLRSEFNSAGRRVDLFTRAGFAYEIVLTNRPRWDEWWLHPKPQHSPRHNYSWFVWDRESARRPSTTYYEGKVQK